MKGNLIRIVSALILMGSAVLGSLLLLILPDRWNTNVWPNLIFIVFLVALQVGIFAILRLVLYRAPVHFPESKTVQTLDAITSWIAVLGFSCPMVELIAVVCTVINLLAGIGVIVLSCQDMRKIGRAHIAT